MKLILLTLIALLVPSLVHGNVPMPSPESAPYPVFLKMGFSSVLEFAEAPSRVVLGDSQSFQVERLEKSLVVRTLVAYANTNMFVYFKEANPRLFVLTASEDAEPTYYRKVEAPKALQAPGRAPAQAVSAEATKRPAQKAGRKTYVASATFDPKKDYLTVETVISAGSDALTRPNWSGVRLRFQTSFKAPYKLWAERKEVQRDSSVKVRFIFAKPNVPLDLSDVSLIVPVEGQVNPLVLDLKKGAR